MKRTFPVLFFLLVFGFPLLAADVQVGKVFTVKHFTKEVIISSPRAADEFILGDKLVVRSAEGREFVLTVTFPMMSVAKCSVQREDIPYLDFLKQGLPVYRYGPKQVEETKYHETWDSDYYSQHRKIRFIKEFKPSQRTSFDLYFLVVYDSSGVILRTTEVKNQKKTVTDYYRDERIIKKQYHRDNGTVYRTLVYDYYPSGIVRESGDFDVDKNTNKVFRYDEAGKLIPEAEASK
jgi:antitoxin component YwqK of YwqJK toxin-antitoxin module